MTTGRLDPNHCEILLKTEHVGRLGCHAAGRTYIVPVTYVFDDGAIYGHTNPGLKLEMLRSNPSVCFEVDHLDNMANWRSVVAWGQFEELSGRAKADALDLLFRRLTPVIRSQTSLPTKGALPGAGAPDSMTGSMLEPTADQVLGGIKANGTLGVVYRIKVSEMSGRYETGVH
jgi:nitroimidazol reductase NimA-like FMN-containing flavoprotein (pyridoxamine 5'-phosphate oxidase superfamily)